MKKTATGILAFFARHNNEFAEKVGFSRVPGTYARYRIVRKHLEAYIVEKYRKEDIPRITCKSLCLGIDICQSEEEVIDIINSS